MKVLFILFTIAMVIIYILSYVNPHSLPFINFSSVLLPYLSIFTLSISFISLLALKKNRSVAILSILLALFILKSHINFGFGSGAETTDDIQLLSYNVSFFSVPTVFKEVYYQRENNQTVFSILERVDSLNPDIISFQEFFNDKKSPFYNVVQQLESKGYHSYLKSSPRHHNGTDRGIITFSKFPIVDKGVICESKNTYNGAIYTDLKINTKDTIRLINAHLTSMAFYSKSSNPLQLMKQFYYAYSTATRERISQLQEIQEMIDSSPHPIVLTGDLNETPDSYLYKQLESSLENAYETTGKGISPTYSSKIPGLAFRIDHIFYDEAILNTSFETYKDWKLSEHNAIKASLELTSND